MNFAKKAITSVLWSSAGNYLGFAVNFVSQLILARLLLPDDFGVFVLAISIFEVLSILTAWSFSIAIIQMPEQDELIDTTFIISLIESFILIFIVALISFGLSICQPNIKNLPVIFFLIGLSRSASLIYAVYSATLEKDLKYTALSIARTIVSIISAIIVIFLAVYKLGVWSLVARELIFSILLLFAFKYISNWKFMWRFNKQLAKKVLAFSSKLLISRSFEAAYYKIDSFLVGILGGINMLGYYTQARYLVDVSNAISAPGSAVVGLPVYSKIQNDENKIKEVSRLWNYFLIRLMLPVVLICIIFPHDIVTFVFGEKWRNSGNALLYLSLFAVLVPVFENLKTLLYGIGSIGTVAFIRLFQIIAAVPLVILGIKFYGMQGASIAFVLSIIFGVVIIYIITRRYTFGSILENVLAPSIAAVTSFICYQFLRLYWFQKLIGLQLFLSMAFIELIYLIVLLLLESGKLKVNFQIIFSRFDKKDK